ncbi:MAG: hypothetical protein ABI572_04840 [Actinomycetota bacterium]
MTRIVKQVLALVLALGLFGGTALAATTHSTSISLSANRTSIHRGQAVNLSGKLTSSFAKCYRYTPVTLYRGHRAVKTKKTSATGTFSFSRRPTVTATWQVRFAGRTGGTHPYQWVCKASASNQITVTVSS